MKTVAQREFRNRISRILREVEAGEPLRITVGGRPVADLVPLGGGRRTFVPRGAVEAIVRRAPLDRRFARDLAAAAGAASDEL